MIKYATKLEMLTAIAEGRKKLDKKLALLSPEEILRPGMMDEWAVKDIVGHLVDWHLLVLGWYEAGLRGEKPYLPSEGYTWRDLPKLNQKFFEQRREQPLQEVLRDFEETYQRELAIIESLSEEDLFEKDRFAWTGVWSLAEYFAANTHKHYDWACKNIRLQKKG